jgi:hypothetical protein
MAETDNKSRTSEIIQEWKPRISYLVIGLVVGPFVANWLGWQVTTDTMETAVEDAVIAYRAELCVTRAQTDPEATPAVPQDYSDRRKLAEKWAVMPGEEKADLDVVSKCSSQLAKL